MLLFASKKDGKLTLCDSDLNCFAWVWCRSDINSTTVQARVRHGQIGDGHVKHSLFLIFNPESASLSGESTGFQQNVWFLASVFTEEQAEELS